MDKRIAKAVGILIILAGASVLAVGTVAASQEMREDRRAERAVGTGVTLGVRVMDADGDPVPGAHVTIVLLRDGEKHRITRDTTDRQGVAIFELRPGGYEIHVRSDAGDAMERLRLHESQRLPITVGQPERPARG